MAGMGFRPCLVVSFSSIIRLQSPSSALLPSWFSNLFLSDFHAGTWKNWRVACWRVWKEPGVKWEKKREQFRGRARQIGRDVSWGSRRVWWRRSVAALLSLTQRDEVTASLPKSRSCRQKSPVRNIEWDEATEEGTDTVQTNRHGARSSGSWIGWCSTG